MSDLTKKVKLRLTGTRPLLMARGDAADPFDDQKRDIEAISQKRKKSLEDHERLSRLQFQSSMYYDPEIGPFLPTDNLFKCMTEGAAKYREGSQVKASVVIVGLVGKDQDPGAAQLIYEGPRDIDRLYEDEAFRFRKMGKIPGSKKSVLITRARFNTWAVEFICEFTEIEQHRIVEYWQRAGVMCGIGAWRLRYGLFSPEVVK